MVKIIKKHLRGLINSNAKSLERISNKLVKVGIDSLAGLMTYLFNQCVDTNILPNVWKSFKVIGLLKCKDSRDDVKKQSSMWLYSI